MVSDLSSSEEIYKKSIGTYEKALKNCGYETNFKYEKNQEKKAKNRKRKRKILWFNPPWNDCVKTNREKNFLKIMEKNFKKGNKLYQMFNRNNCKVSYRTSPNLGMIINSHNKKILKKVK